MNTKIKAFYFLFVCVYNLNFSEIMPKRKIKKSYRQVTGALSSRKNSRLISSESTLERDLYILLDFDPLVESFEEQPEIIPYNLADGRLSRYTPDCLINLAPKPAFIWQYSPFRLFFRSYHEGSGRSLNQSTAGANKLKGLTPKNSRRTPKAIMVEVKYRQDLLDNWKELKPKFKAARIFSRERSWEFRVLTEKEIRTPLLNNIKFIRPFRRYNFAPEEMMKVLNRLAELESCKLIELLNSLTEKLTEQGHLLPIIWHLVGRHEIEINWSNPITMNSNIRSLV